ncbi:DUF3037 domain-containing protein [Mariprofundus erugo]|uniref:DUF3037 domain-containing protein n=1 Tax=Mariprofundus erugo TaxID=2528639 RepID=UPI0010FED02A|nr:DUF3037 domain-containing protein [Mariprofundus erugo]TLS77050.1 DUF3037 domain-containing protein [Mariprofundus erugo]
MKFEYQLLLLEPDMIRGERINIGLIVYRGNSVDIRMPGSLPKLRAIDPAFTPRAIEKAKATLIEMANASTDIFKEVSLELGPIHTSKIGWFNADGNDDYEAKVDDLLKRLVFAPVRKKKRAPASRLVVSLKKEFQRKGFLGQSPEDISNHRIIPAYTISEEEGLKADFAYKNGVFHITTVADLRAKSSSLAEKQGRGALKAITMLHGKRKLGGKAYAVYAATANKEREVQPVIAMLEEYSDGNIYNFLSADDMTRYHRIVADHLNRPQLH